MRRLARELNVTPGALYWHFADKQELLGAVADRILEPATATAAGAAWARTHPRDLLGAARRAAVAHRRRRTGLGQLRRGQVRAHRRDPRPADRRRGRGGHRPRRNADLAARTVLYYVLGFTADEQSRLQWDAAGALADDQSVLATNPNGRFAFGLAPAGRRDGRAARRVRRSGCRPWRHRPSDVAPRTCRRVVRADAVERCGEVGAVPAGDTASRAASTDRDARAETAPASGAARRSSRPTACSQQSRRGTISRTRVRVVPEHHRRTDQALAAEAARPAPAAPRRRPGRSAPHGQRHVRPVRRRPVVCLARQTRLGQRRPVPDDGRLGGRRRRAVRRSAPWPTDSAPSRPRTPVR